MNSPSFIFPVIRPQNGTLSQIFCNIFCLFCDFYVLANLYNIFVLNLCIMHKHDTIVVPSAFFFLNLLRDIAVHKPIDCAGFKCYNYLQYII